MYNLKSQEAYKLRQQIVARLMDADGHLNYAMYWFNRSDRDSDVNTKRHIDEVIKSLKSAKQIFEDGKEVFNDENS